MQIVSLGDNLHEMSKSISWKTIQKLFQNVNYFPGMLSVSAYISICQNYNENWSIV